MKSVLALYKICKNVGPPRGGPLKNFARLAIARHDGPPIKLNLFVIPTLV